MRLMIAVLFFVSSALSAALPPCHSAGVPDAAVPSGTIIFLEFPTDTPRRYVVSAGVTGPCLGPPSHCTARIAEGYTVEPDDSPFILLFTPRASTDRDYRISILGTSADAGDPVLQCQTRVDVPLLAHPPLAAVSDRVVVPVAVTAATGKGQQTRSALRLTGYGSGTIYFRSADGFSGDDGDPSIRYDLGPIPLSGIPGTVLFDDIAAALSVSGMGMLDIIPDEITEDPRGGLIAPRVEAWTHNTRGNRNSNVTGAIPPEILARGALHAILPEGYPSSSRVNLGYRTFDQPAHLFIGVMARDLEGIIIFNEIDVPAHTFRQVSLESLVPSSTIRLEPGDIVIVLEENEDAPLAAYYSVTNAASGDSEIFYEPEHWDPDHIGDIVLKMADWY